MQQPGAEMLNEKLIAFLDGETNDEATAEIAALLAEDPVLADRLHQLETTTALVRDAFAPVLGEPVPAHLLALVQTGPMTAEPAAKAAVLPFRKRLAAATRPSPANVNRQRWWLGMAAAAAVSGIVVGASVDYFTAGTPQAAAPASTTVASADAGPGSAGWLDTVAGYHNLFISTANAGENTAFDVAPGAEKKGLPTDIRVPNLKPWGLGFEGARRIILDSRPAFQFFYRPGVVAASVSPTAGKPVGPITIFVTTTTRGELAPRFERRDQVNMLYWRHQGHSYAIVGQADRGWMFSLANDIAYQVSAH
jgi:anti-sigma factor RsiW